MRKQCAVTVAVGSLVVGFGTWWVGTAMSARADHPAVATSGIIASVPGLADEKYDYVGSTKCKKCHLKEHKSWEKTKMGKAFETLKPGQAVDVKKKFNLDPNKDYTKDATCLACHTTGFGHKGGYAIPPEGDEKAAKQAKNLEGGGCESCHGPGGKYNEVFEEIMKSKRKYKVEELYAAGLTKIEASTCTVCHNEKGPTFDPSKPFDFEKMKTQDVHEHVPLQQRE